MAASKGNDGNGKEKRWQRQKAEMTTGREAMTTSKGRDDNRKRSDGNVKGQR